MYIYIFIQIDQELSDLAETRNYDKECATISAQTTILPNHHIYCLSFAGIF